MGKNRIEDVAEMDLACEAKDGQSEPGSDVQNRICITSLETAARCGTTAAQKFYDIVRSNTGKVLKSAR